MQCCASYTKKTSFDKTTLDTKVYRIYSNLIDLRENKFNSSLLKSQYYRMQIQLFQKTVINKSFHAVGSDNIKNESTQFHSHIFTFEIENKLPEK